MRESRARDEAGAVELYDALALVDDDDRGRADGEAEDSVPPIGFGSFTDYVDRTEEDEIGKSKLWLFTSQPDNLVAYRSVTAGGGLRSWSSLRHYTRTPVGRSVDHPRLNGRVLRRSSSGTWEE